MSVTAIPYDQYFSSNVNVPEYGPTVPSSSFASDTFSSLNTSLRSFVPANCPCTPATSGALFTVTGSITGHSVSEPSAPYPSPALAEAVPSTTSNSSPAGFAVVVFSPDVVTAVVVVAAAVVVSTSPPSPITIVRGVVVVVYNWLFSSPNLFSSRLTVYVPSFIPLGILTVTLVIG